MSFREKVDWCSFVSLCVFGFFFVELARMLLFPTSPRHDYFHLFFGLAGLVITIQILSYVFLTMRSPRDAKTPVDEREQLIRLRAARPAYFVLLVGVFVVIGTLHLGFTTWQFAHCILFVIWLAELTRYGMRLAYYRREL